MANVYWRVDSGCPQWETCSKGFWKRSCACRARTKQECFTKLVTHLTNGHDLSNEDAEDFAKEAEIKEYPWDDDQAGAQGVAEAGAKGADEAEAPSTEAQAAGSKRKLEETSNAQQPTVRARLPPTKAPGPNERKIRSPPPPPNRGGAGPPPNAAEQEVRPDAQAQYAQGYEAEGDQILVRKSELVNLRNTIEVAHKAATKSCHASNLAGKAFGEQMLALGKVLESVDDLLGDDS